MTESANLFFTPDLSFYSTLSLAPHTGSHWSRSEARHVLDHQSGEKMETEQTDKLQTCDSNKEDSKRETKLTDLVASQTDNVC